MCSSDLKVIPLEQLPDETFASAILGPGCGVEPTGDTVYAPFDGTVTPVSYTHLVVVLPFLFCLKYCVVQFFSITSARRKRNLFCGKNTKPPYICTDTGRCFLHNTL